MYNVRSGSAGCEPAIVARLAEAGVSEEEVQDLVQKVAALRQRVQDLRERAVERPDPEELKETLAALDTSLQELLVAGEQLQAQQQALEAERRRYREITDLVGTDACLLTDGDGTIQEANRAAAHLLRAARHDLCGQPLAAFVAPKDQPAFSSFLQGLQRNPSAHPSDWEIDLAPREGPPIAVAVTAMAASPANSPRPALHWLLRDISRRRQAEARLRFLAESSRQLAASLDYESTLESVAQLAVPMIADWVEVAILADDGQVRYLTIAHCEPDKARLVRELASKYPLGPQSPEGLQVALQTGRPYLAEMAPAASLLGPAPTPEMAGLLAELHPTAYIIVPLVARNRTLGIILLVLSSPGRRYARDDLELAAELGHRAALAIDNARLYREAQEAVAARDQFLSAAAHELKTPITNLYGYTQLQLRRFSRRGGQDEPERVRRTIEVIGNQSARLARLVSRLLDLSLIEAGTLTLRRERLDLVKLTRSVLAAQQAATQRHTITLQAPESLVATVDPERLRCVLADLVENALKFGQAGRPVHVELFQPSPGLARLIVRDYGSGVPPARRAQLFSRFYQAQTGQAFSGLGLGLYVSRHIIEAHGGHIDAHFPADGGTLIVVTLPTEQADTPLP